MAWFRFVGDEVALPWKQWREARNDPDDLDALIALGRRVLRESAGTEVKPADVRRTDAIARLLEHAYKGRDPELIKTTALSLEGREPPNEPRLWDPPGLDREAHRRLLRRSKVEPLSAQALLLGDELDARIRPGLLRTFWIMTVAAGGKGTYRDAMIDPALQPRPLSYAIQGLRIGLAAPGPRYLDPRCRTALEALADETDALRSGHFTVDDVIWCIKTGSFRYSEGWLELAKGTEWILVSPGELRRRLRKALRIAAVLEAEKVMLLAMIAHSIGGLRPKGVSIQSLGCDKRGSGPSPPGKA